MPTFALEPTRAITQYVQEQWPADELPSSAVATMAQTPDGYLWLGTQNGLVRFDGVAYRVYDRHNTAVLRNELVRTLLVDREGTLWIGTSDGLYRMRGGIITAITDRDHPAPVIIFSLAEDRQGALWIGTSKGLHRLDDKNSESFAAMDGAPTGSVGAIVGTNDGAIWFGSLRHGLIKLDHGAFTAYSLAPDDAGSYITALCADRAGDLWIGTLSSGLRRFSAGALVDDRVAAAVPKQRISALAVDENDSLWVPTEGAGLFRIQGDRLASYAARDGLSRDIITALFFDRAGSLWLGFDSTGLTRLRDGIVTPYTPSEGLAHEQASAIYQDDAGDIWVATLGGGLSRFKDAHFVNYTTRDGLASDHIGALAGARQGGVWIGTRAGLSYFDGEKKWTAYTARDGVPPFAIWSVLEDHRGTLWIGTSGGGLVRREGEKFVTYGTGEGLGSLSVRALLEDERGDLWVGAYGDGLLRIHEGQTTRYLAKDGLVPRFIVSLYRDRDGVLWLGSIGDGLIRFKDGRFSVIGTAQGLLDDSVNQILEDDAGQLWTCTNKGIFRVAKSELDAVAEGRRRAVNAVGYSKSDGMKSAECNGGLQPAGWKMRDGTMWFPTIKGVAVIDPAHLQGSRSVPHVIVESYAVNHQALRELDPARDGVVTLAPGTNALEIHFTATGLLVPAKNRFRYQLDGFDRDWIDVGARRAAYYTNLPPGTYRFRVDASNDDGTWDAPGASLAFALEPFFHQTLTFKLALGLLALALLWSLHRVRLKLVMARNAVLLERQRIAREIHDDLGQQLSAAVMLLAAVRKALVSAPEQAGPLVEQTSGMIRDSVEETRRSIWALRPQQLQNADLATALQALIAHQPDGGVPIAFELIGTPRKLPESTEAHLLRIAQEALSNALHHAHPSRVRVMLVYEPGALRLCIDDDGRGIGEEASAPGHGLGVPGMRERAAQIGATLQIASAPAQGTRIELRLPRPGRIWHSLSAALRSMLRRRATDGRDPPAAG